MTWSIFTNFGNSAILVPLGVLAFYLVCRHEGVGAGVRWALAFAAGSVAVAVSKVLFYGWGVGVPGLNLTGFSGHAFLALTVWPLMSWLALKTFAPRLAWAPGLVLGLLVAFSRVGTGAHSIAEVVAGGLLALAVLGSIGIGSRPAERRDDESGGERGVATRLPLLLFTPMLGLMLPLTVQHTLPTERYFSQIGIALSGVERPMSRDRWLRQWEEGRRQQGT